MDPAPTYPTRIAWGGFTMRASASPPPPCRCWQLAAGSWQRGVGLGKGAVLVSWPLGGIQCHVAPPAMLGWGSVSPLPPSPVLAASHWPGGGAGAGERLFAGSPAPWG